MKRRMKRHLKALLIKKYENFDRAMNKLFRDCISFWLKHDPKCHQNASPCILFKRRRIIIDFEMEWLELTFYSVTGFHTYFFSLFLLLV